MAEDQKKAKAMETAATSSKKLPDLPEYLIVKLLSNLPVKSLLRFKCVSRNWYGMISNPIFVKTHLNRSSLATKSNLNLMFIHPRPFKLYSLELDDALEQREPAVVKMDHHPLGLGFSVGEAHVVGACNGLLCVAYSEDDIFLWNPSIRRHQKLPADLPFYSWKANIIYGFGYDPISNDYKVLKITKYDGVDPNSSSYSSKVYSLRNNSWKRINAMPPLKLLGSPADGQYVDSAFHWYVIGSETITSFDLKDEKFREVPLPDINEEDEHPLDVSLLQVEERLCFFRQFYTSSSRVECVECWMMKQKSWTKLFVFSTEEQVPPMHLRRFGMEPFCFLKNGEILFGFHSCPELFLYDPRTGSVSVLGLRDVQGLRETHRMIYRGSLVPLNAKD